MRKRNPVDDEVEWNELKCVPVVVLVTVGGDCMSKRVSLWVHEWLNEVRGGALQWLNGCVCLQEGKEAVEGDTEAGQDDAGEDENQVAEDEEKQNKSSKMNHR